MRKIFRHLKKYIFRGFLAVIPLGLSFLVVRLIYLAVDVRLSKLLNRLFGFHLPGLGIFLLLLFLYLLGLAASNWLGRRAFKLIDVFTTRIPLVKTVYNLGKQLAEALSLPEKQAFKKPVLVEHFRPGLWSIGFVTGIVAAEDKRERLVKVFLPTAPNPTSGFMVLLKESQVKDLTWTVPEAMQTIISGGITGPETL